MTAKGADITLARLAEIKALTEKAITLAVAKEVSIFQQMTGVDVRGVDVGVQHNELHGGRGQTIVTGSELSLKLKGLRL